MTAPKKKVVATTTKKATPAKATTKKVETTKKEVVKQPTAKKVVVQEPKKVVKPSNAKKVVKKEESKVVAKSTTKKVVSSTKPVVNKPLPAPKFTETKTEIKWKQIGKNLNVVIGTGKNTVVKTKTASKEELQPIKDLLNKYESISSVVAANKIKDLIIKALTKKEKEKKEIVENKENNLKIEKKVLKNTIKKTDVKKQEKVINEISSNLKSKAPEVHKATEEAKAKKEQEQPKATTGQTRRGEYYR